MKQSFLILQNKDKQTARVIPFTHEAAEVIFRHDLNRIEIVRDTQTLEEEGIEFKSLGSVSKTSVPGDVVVKGPWGQIKHIEKIDEFVIDKKEREEEDVKRYPFFLKWTAVAEVAMLVIVMLVGIYLNKKAEEEEPQTVQVVRRIEKPQVIELTKKPKQVENHKFAKAIPKKTVVKKTVSITAKKSVAQNLRSGNQLKQMGALNVLGGMKLDANGLGGFSQAPSNSSGFGFDKLKASGGNSRGMLGKGMVQAGIGSGQTLKGYDGNGLSGKGSGQMGRGNLNMAGTSGGYYLPLSEEAVIEGGLDPDQVNAVIQRHRGQLTYCYEKGLQIKPNLSGRVSVNFTISPHGGVDMAKIAHTSLESQQVESCIINKLQTWRFPKPKGNVEVKVTYPFILKRLNQG